MSQCLLTDRGVLSVSGAEAEGFLNRLVTNSVLAMAPGEARFAALLSPQGKLTFDFFVVRNGEGFLIDCVADQAADLARRLVTFRLRSKVAVANESATHGVAAVWQSVLMEAPGRAFRDPRHNALGYRIIAPHEALRPFGDPAAVEIYDAHRIACGVPRGGVDFVYGDSFVHDANMDLLHGIDFDKGCYVGQEVVSRVHHRKSARRRVARLQSYGGALKPGAAVQAGQTALGTVTSVADGGGLASLRVDHLAEAEATHSPVMVDDILVAVALPSASLVETPAYAQDLYD